MEKSLIRCWSEEEFGYWSLKNKKSNESLTKLKRFSVSLVPICRLNIWSFLTKRFLCMMSSNAQREGKGNLAQFRPLWLTNYLTYYFSYENYVSVQNHNKIDYKKGIINESLYFYILHMPYWIVGRGHGQNKSGSGSEPECRNKGRPNSCFVRKSAIKVWLSRSAGDATAQGVVKKSCAWQ